jgi:hypothetical protein
MNGWKENKKLVLHRLEEMEHHVRSMQKKITRLEKDMAVSGSQTRIVAGIIGAVAGLVPALVAVYMASRL